MDGIPPQEGHGHDSMFQELVPPHLELTHVQRVVLSAFGSAQLYSPYFPSSSFLFCFWAWGWFFVVVVVRLFVCFSLFDYFT